MPTCPPLAFQVVLLGDHKQLRPVVNNDFCKTLGMETSLFERYQSQALMLDTQYRMVGALNMVFSHFPPLLIAITCVTGRGLCLSTPFAAQCLAPQALGTAWGLWMRLQYK